MRHLFAIGKFFIGSFKKGQILSGHRFFCFGFFLSIVFLFVNLKAEISDLNFTNFSQIEQSGSSVTLFGGLAGTTAGCNLNGDSPCNNCKGAIAICNEARIYDGLKLTVSFKTNNQDVITANSRILFKVGENSETPITQTDPLVVNSTLSATIDWGSLCTAGGLTSCEIGTTNPISVTVGIDKDNDDDLDESTSFKIHPTGEFLTTSKLFHADCRNSSPNTSDNEGFCDFKVFPGDGKVFIIDETAALDTYNSTGKGTTYKGVRIYFNEATSATCDATTESEFGNISLDSAFIDFDATSDEDGSFFLEDNSITELENGKGYIFLLANRDVAGNIFYFSPFNASSPTTDYLSCDQHFAVPEVVVGLLDGNQCFIATAAFGSNNSEQVKILRQFRDEYLLTNAIGKKITEFYYRISPPLANIIKEHSELKMLARALITPLAWGAELALWSGLTAFILIFSFLSLLLVFFRKKIGSR